MGGDQNLRSVGRSGWMLLIITGDAHRTTSGRSNNNPYLLENPISLEATLEKEFILAFIPPARSKKHMEKHNNSTSPRQQHLTIEEAD